MVSRPHTPAALAAPTRHNDGVAGGPPRFFALLQSPSGTVLAGSCTRGMSRSTDAGVTWTPVEALTDVSINGFAIAADSSLLAATSGGLARSTDDGTTWTISDPRPIYAVSPSGALTPDGLVTYRLIQLPDGTTLAGTDGHGVWAHDGGGWRALGLAGMIVYALAVTPTGAILAGTRGDHLWRSVDSGVTWAQSTSGIPDSYVHCLHVEPDGTIVAGTGMGMARSTDDGSTWTGFAESIAGNRIFAVTGLDDGRLLAGGYAQVWVGGDDAWAPVDPGLTPDESWAVHFVDADEVLAGTKAGIMRSPDRGRSWQPTGEPTIAFNFITTDDGTTLAASHRGVHTAPDWAPIAGLERWAWSLLDQPGGALLVGTLDDGLWRQSTGGFERVTGGLDHRQIFGLLETRTGALIACTGAVIGGVKTGGLFRSDDGGSTWQLAWFGENVYRVVSLSDGTLYAAARRCLVLESANDGRDWSACPPAVQHEAKTYSLGVDRDDRLYLGSGSQLMRSADRARTWQVLDQGLDGLSIYAIRQGPQGDLVVATSAGLFRSSTGGDSWEPGERTH